MQFEVPEIMALKNNDFDGYRRLMEKYNFPEKKFDSYKAFRKYVCGLDMHLLLGLPTEHFFCLFHHSDTPDANIFQSKNGVWLYKCFEYNCNAYTAMDVFCVIKTLFQNPISDFQSHLAQALNCTVKERFNLRDIADVERQNLRLLQSWSEECPELGKLLKGTPIKVLKYFYNEIVTYLGEHCFADRSQYLVSESNRYIAKQIETKNKISNILGMLTFLGIIERLHIYQIKPSRLESLPRCDGRVINQILVRALVDEDKELILKNAKEWYRKKYTLSSFTMTNLLEDGEIFLANRCFVELTRRTGRKDKVEKAKR